MPVLTKTPIKKRRLNPVTKSYQMRLTITPEIYKDILRARRKYKYLDDTEIIKIFIGRGADLDSQDDLDYLLNTNWSKSANPNAFENPEEAMEWLISTKDDPKL